MNGSDGIVKNLISMISKCAKHMDIHPYQVQYNDIQRYASEMGPIINPTQAHQIKMQGGFTNIRDAHFKPVLTQASVKVAAVAKENRSKAKTSVIQDVYLDRFTEICKDLFKKPVVISNHLHKKTKITSRHLHLLISDTHFGAFLKAIEGFVSYSNVEPARRLADIALKTVEYKPEYRKQTKLFINLNGDILQGNIHDSTSSMRMAEQKAMALWLFVQFVGYLAKHFPEVEVNCTTGNHDRYFDKNPSRVTNEKWDSHATDVYFALKLASAHLNNVKINIPLTPWATYKSFGTNYFVTHGDGIINVGNPGSSVNVKSIENQINKLNASLNDKNEYKVILLGHVHTGMMLRLNNGVTVITNPPLIPPDGFAQSIGIFESPTGQWLFESVDGYPVGDSRLLTVDTNTDSNSSLDSIIKPFNGF